MKQLFRDLQGKWGNFLEVIYFTQMLAIEREGGKKKNRNSYHHKESQIVRAF